MEYSNDKRILTKANNEGNFNEYHKKIPTNAKRKRFTDARFFIITRGSLEFVFQVKSRFKHKTS